MIPGFGVGRRVASLLLSIALDREDREDALEDLETLAGRVRSRRGRLVANVWLVWHALGYVARGLAAAVTPGGRAGVVHRGRAAGVPSTASSRRRLWAWDGWARDFRLALRRVRRSPLASAVIVLTLGVGVGAGTSVFAVLNVLVFGPLPFGDPESLVRVDESVTIAGMAEPRRVSVSPRRFEQLRDRSDVFEGVVAARYRTFTLAGEGGAERVIGLRVTADFFDVLGVSPHLGRDFGAEEDAPGAPAPVAVLSNALWTRRFGGDAQAVGAEIVVNGRAHTVVGVMPPGFRYPYAGEIWLPMGIDPTGADYESNGLNVSARLAPGVSFEAAQRGLDGLAAELAAERPDVDAIRGFRFHSIEDEVLEDVPQKVVALLWAAAFVLLIGAANVASMILARMHGERLAMDLRVVLGARRSDLARRLFMESAVLAALGLALGAILSGQTVGLLTALSPVSDLGPYFQDVRLSPTVLAFGGLLALGAMMLASVPTFVRLRREVFGVSTRSGGVGPGRGRFGISFLDSLVAVEVALAVVLLAGAGLTTQTLRDAWSRDIGIEAEGLHVFGVSPTPSGFSDPAERIAYLGTVLERVRALPGVAAVGATNLNPMRSQGWGARVWPEGRDVMGDLDHFTINHRAVTPGYLEAAGTDLIAGRRFDARDGPEGAPVALVSRRTADLLWPGEEPVGQLLRAGRAGEDRDVVTVIGVVEDVDEFDFLGETWYRPYAQDPRDYNTEVLEIFVRSDLPSETLVPQVRQAISSVAAGVPVFRVESMHELLRLERKIESFAALLLLIFAGVGVLLAGVGIYGVLSYSTGRRTAELGLRVALGAGRDDVLRDVTWRAARSCLVGLAGGLTGALALARFLEAVVPDVPTFRFDVFVVATALTLMVGVVASLGPASRALRIDPRSALDGG